MKELMPYLTREFGVTNPGDVLWSHAVNDVTKLARFLADQDTMVIESDIRESRSGVAVAVHPPETESDLTFESLITQVGTSNKALKLDFKDPQILEYCMQYLKTHPLPQPVLLNADVLHGNGAKEPPITGVGFLGFAKQLYPQGMLSLGWSTTDNPNHAYTKDTVSEMMNLTRGQRNITFAVRACLLPRSWDNLQPLLSQTGNTFTIWNNEDVTPKLTSWVLTHTDPRRTYYDFIDRQKNPIRNWKA